MAEAQIVTGAFKNLADTPFFIPISCQIDEFRLVNLTRSGITALGVSGSLSSTLISQAEFFPRYMSQGTALVYQNGTASGNVSPLNAGNLAQNGFTLINPSSQQNGPNIVINSFTPGTTTTFTTNTAHGFVVGDIVRINTLPTANQLGSLTMTVTAVGSTTTFTTLLNSSNALTSTGIVFKVRSGFVAPRSLYYPTVAPIAAITLANPMVVTLLVQQNYQVSDVVRFQIPTVFGAQQLNSTTNGLPVEFTVIAVNNAVGTQTVTLAYDATALTAFAWPAASSYPFSLPEMIPQGEGNINNFQSFGVVPAPLPYGNQNILGFATQNIAQNGILVGVGDGTSATTTGGLINSTSHAQEAWEWRAICSSATFP